MSDLLYNAETFQRLMYNAISELLYPGIQLDISPQSNADEALRITRIQISIPASDTIEDSLRAALRDCMEREAADVTTDNAVAE